MWNIGVIIGFNIIPFLCVVVNYLIIWRMAALITVKDNSLYREMLKLTNKEKFSTNCGNCYVYAQNEVADFQPLMVELSGDEICSSKRRDSYLQAVEECHSPSLNMNRVNRISRASSMPLESNRFNPTLMDQKQTGGVRWIYNHRVSTQKDKHTNKIPATSESQISNPMANISLKNSQCSIHKVLTDGRGDSTKTQTSHRSTISGRASTILKRWAGIW